MIAECLLIKNENRYLLEHLAYNAAAGIEHFFIYDNLSDTPVAAFLREMPAIFSTFAPLQGIRGEEIRKLIVMQII